MSLDISHILHEWPYQSDQISARRIRGDDGRDKIQLRLDLGMLQMEVTGRPDGQRPFGQDCLLGHYEHLLAAYKLEHAGDEGFSLDEQACERLRAEGMLYYHRYVAEFVLEDFEAVERDTARNLRLFDFCAAYAAEESDRYVMEQYRPYVLMMSTRARARIALKNHRPKAALVIVRKGLDSIRSFYRRFGHDKAAANSAEIATLKAMAKEIEGHIPVDPILQLKKKLAKAVEEERYEDAAQLRDQLRRSTGQDNPESQQ